MLSLQGAGFLLSELCERLGLCLPPEARRQLVEQALPDAASFTDAVFAAEGFEGGRANRALYADALALAERAYADNRRADT
jgi:hypothetical protein